MSCPFFLYVVYSNFIEFEAWRKFTRIRQSFVSFTVVKIRDKLQALNEYYLTAISLVQSQMILYSRKNRHFVY